MNQLMLPYIMQMLPILAGALVLIILKNIKVTRSKITIFTDENAPACNAADFEEHWTDGHNAASPAKPAEAESSCDTIDSFFYDSLIVKGQWSKNSRMRDIRRQAFEKLGYLHQEEIGSLPRYMKKYRSERLTLFISDAERGTLLNFASSFGELGGLLLWYAANENLQVSVYA